MRRLQQNGILWICGVKLEQRHRTEDLRVRLGIPSILMNYDMGGSVTTFIYYA